MLLDWRKPDLALSVVRMVEGELAAVLLLRDGSSTGRDAEASRPTR